MRKLCGVFFLALSITAITARAQHSVLVAWTPSVDAGANPSLTYNVYRSTSCTGSFATLNSSPIASMSFTDANVFDGDTYCYQVTAVLSGSESSASNQATAVIPAAPASPANAAAGPATTPKEGCTRHATLASWLRCIAALPHAAPRK